MSISTTITLSNAGDGQPVNGKINFSDTGASVLFFVDGERYFVTTTPKSLRVRRTGTMTYELNFCETQLCPVSINVGEGKLDTLYMTTHSLNIEQGKDYLKANATYSFDLSNETRSFEMLCKFYEN